MVYVKGIKFWGNIGKCILELISVSESKKQKNKKMAGDYRRDDECKGFLQNAL